MAVCSQCGRDLPAEARFCPACGAAVAEPPPRSVEERKLATVLFADLVGSTALGGSQDPERTRVMLDRFYDAMAAEIQAAGGTVEKFAGDAVMAAFGAPAALEDHAERALHAALAMQRRLRALFGEALALRIGVNTGDVVVGRPREGSSFVTGDAVNVAARLEQAAPPGEIYVGARAAAAAQGAFEFGAGRVVEAKGKEGGVEALPLLRALSLMRPRGVGGLRRAFVGRDEELDLLLATYARAVRQGDAHMVTIAADAGVGKTRLVRELWERLASESTEPLRRTGRCLPYGRGITYWPLGEVLKEHLGILESDGADTVRVRLGGREILGLSLGLDVGSDLHPLEARDRLHDAWIEFIDSLASERPLVLLIEDLHWAEEPLLDLLERGARDVRRPLLVIATARPELMDKRPSWGGGTRNASMLWLEPLTPEDSAHLLDELLAEALPDRMRDVVVSRGEGNPFFVEELLRTLIDRRLLEQRDGRWCVTDLPDQFEIPDSVHAVLAARMDLLPPDQKVVLQAASVIGRVFWDGAVCDLAKVDPDFALLEDRDFIRHRSGSSTAGQREYAFKHALTREVAYASLPKARRARLHAAFAHWLESTGEGRDEHAPLLAHHYGEAVRAEDADLAWPDGGTELVRLQRRAAVWLRRAGEQAVQRYELDDGIALLQRALELEEDRNAQAELWREIGRANALGFHGDEFWDAMERSLELTDDQSVQAETYAELAVQTSMRGGMWNRAPEHELVNGWIDRALELSAPGSAARAKALCSAVMWIDRTDLALAEEALQIADALADDELRALALMSCSMAAYLANDFAASLEWSRHAYEVSLRLTDPEAALMGYEAVIPAQVMFSEFAGARDLSHDFDEAAGRLSPHHRMHGVAITTELEELYGGWRRIVDLAPRVESAVSANLGTPCVRNQRTLLVCAAAHRLAGDAGEAERLERRAEDLGMEGYDMHFSGPRLRLALLKDDVDAVERILASVDALGGARHLYWFNLSNVALRLDAFAHLDAGERVEREGAPLAELEGTYIQPFALRALGRVRRDRELVRQACERFHAMGLGWHAEQTRALL